MPKGIENFFPQIESILLEKSNLKELKKEDLARFPKLKVLYFTGNDLETLESNLFEANPDIKVMWFNKNKLRFIGENILMPLQKLTYASFGNNICIDLVAGLRDEFSTLIEELHNRCKPPQVTTLEESEESEESENKIINT